MRLKRSETASSSHAGIRLLRLWALGIAVDVIAVLFSLRYPLRGHADGLTDIGKWSHYHWPNFATYTGGMLAIVVLGWLALRETRHLPARIAAAPVFTCGAIALIFFGMMYPVNAIDVFIYASRSRLWSRYGENPIAVKPAVHELDAWRRFASEWGNSTSPYGPLWNWIAWPITKLSGVNIGEAVAGFKALAVVSSFTCTVLIYKIANRLRPGTGAGAALLFCWNPLLLWEGAGNGHNDVVMLVPLLVALLAFTRKRYAVVIPAIVVAALIKYVAVLLVPAAVVAIWRLLPNWRDRLRTAIFSALGSAFAIAFSLAPFFDIHAIRASVQTQGDIVLTSPASLAVGLLKSRYAIRDIEHWARIVGLSLFAGGFVVQLILTFRRPGRLPRAWFEIFFLYLIAASWTVRPWYGLWLVALAAVLPNGWPRARALVWSLGGLASYGLWIWGWEWWKADYYTVQNLAVEIMFGPPLLLTLIELVRLKRRRPHHDPLASPASISPVEAG